jgi:cell division septation protein DedD
MRYVILILVVMNCAYFSWQVFLKEPMKPAGRLLPPLPPDVERLVTLEESAARESQSEIRQIEDLTATQPPGAILPLSCQALGPFLSQSELKPFEKRLDRLGLAARPQVRYQQEQVGYTVLMPPVEYEEALQVKRRLEKENITASITGKDNVLTLGSFRNRLRAENVLAHAQALGLEPHIEPGYARRSTYWLVFRKADKQDAGLAGITRKNSALRVETMACP